jgi:hypothetical protein
VFDIIPIIMTERMQLLYHHGEMLGFVESVRRQPSRYLGDKYAGMEDLTDEEAVEIYMTEVIDNDLCYRTKDPQIRQRYKEGILQAVLAEKKGRVEYIPDSSASGDVICHGCYQFQLERPDSPGCVRRKKT